jgi:hypothetical protein
MKPRLNKNKTCKQCKRKFEQKQLLQYVCSLECSIDYSKALQKNKEQKENKEFKKKIKEKHKTWSSYVKDVEIVFNAFIRERDKNLPCISCDALAGTYKLTAGHFYPTTYQCLRFNEDNVHGQCWFNCNKNKHGNVNEYRIRLIEKIGIKRVEQLDEDRVKKLDLTIPELIELKVNYKDKLRVLKKR